MIYHFLGDAIGVLSCQFWSTVLQSGARLPIHTLNYWTVKSVVKVKFSMARSLKVENLLPQNVGSIINYLQ